MPPTPSSAPRDSRAPLAGIRVLDLTEGDGAPYAAMQLGDAGAEVIKVERPCGDWARPLGGPFDHGDGPLFMSMNRNKRSIVVDLEQDAGRAIVRALARNVDVVIHSFPAAADAARLGLDYGTLSADHPALIYCDVSLLERHGPEADLPATDLTLQARAGVPRFLGRRGGPMVRIGWNYAGVTAGMYAMQAIVAALYARAAMGRGQHIETSYLRAMVATQTNNLTAFSDPDEVPPSGMHTNHLEPPIHGVPTLDGPVFFTYASARDPEVLRHLLERLGLWETVPRPSGSESATPSQQAAQPYIEAAFRTRPRSEVLALLEEIGLMNAPVHDYGTLFGDEGVLEQEMLVTVDHPTRGRTRLVGLPWKLTDTPASICLAPPTLGEHTDEVLRGLGYDDARIAALRASGAIA